MKFKIKPLVLVLALCLALVPILSFENRSASSSLAPNGTSRLYSTQSSGSRYYFDLGEMDPTLTGSFSFEIPTGYTLSYFTPPTYDEWENYYYTEIFLEGPTIIRHTYYGGKWHTEEIGPDSNYVYLDFSPDAPAEGTRNVMMGVYCDDGLCTPGQRKVNGYDDYYFFHEDVASLHVYGYISFGEGGCFGYWFLTSIGVASTPDYYQTIDGVRLEEAHEQLIDGMFSSIRVSDLPAPTASFTYSPSSPATDEDVQFTDTSTDPDGTIVSWSWDFGDGTPTSSSQNPSHSYSSTGTYTVTLTVTDDDGLTDSHSESLKVGDLRVESGYKGFFLHNVNAITNTYEAIPSPELAIDMVVFDMDGKTQTDYSSPWEAEFNMGDVGLNPTLVVTAYKAGGGTISTSLEPEILETPSLLIRMINAGQVTVSKKAGDYWRMEVKDEIPGIAATRSVGDSPVPFDIGIGRYKLSLSDWTLDFVIESDDYNKRVDFGQIGLSIKRADFMNKKAGVYFDVKLSGGFTVGPPITPPTITLSLGGSASWTFYTPHALIPTPIGPIPITASVTPSINAAVDIGFGPDHPIKVDEVGGHIGGGIGLTLGVGVPKVSAGGYFDGTITAYFKVRPFDFDKVCVKGKMGLYFFVIGIFDLKKELWDGDWCSNPGLNASSQSEGEWELIDRDYLGPGYSTFVWPEGEREGPLVENVFSNPQPSIATAESGSIVAAWTYDDPEKDLSQALEIIYSTYDPQDGTWSEPQQITSDNFLDLNPELAYLGNGQVIAVWQRVPRELGEEVSLSEYARNVELAYSTFNLETGEWSQPQLVTSNNSYDTAPALASYGNETLLVYLKDSDNNPFTLDDQTLVATEWAGGSWSAEETIASGITVIGSPRLSLAGMNEGILAFVRDVDDNVLTTSDREVFYLRYDGGWEAPTRLTTDNLEERSPSVGRANNRWYLSWIEMEPTENALGYTTSVRFGELTGGQLAENSSLLENQEVTDQFLLGEIHDKLYLLYQVGARGAPRLIRYDGSAWENVDNFLWSPKVENARTSQLSVSVEGNHLGAVGATVVQAGAEVTSTSLHASTFSLCAITASVEPSGGGSVTLSPSEGPYVAGTEVTVTANAAPSYRFDYWSDDVTGTSDTIVLNIDSDKSITAHFVEIAETPWALIGGTIAAVVIGVIVAVIFFRRK